MKEAKCIICGARYNPGVHPNIFGFCSLRCRDIHNDVWHQSFLAGDKVFNLKDWRDKVDVMLGKKER